MKKWSTLKNLTFIILLIIFIMTFVPVLEAKIPYINGFEVQYEVHHYSLFSLLFSNYQMMTTMFFVRIILFYALLIASFIANIFDKKLITDLLIELTSLMAISLNYLDCISVFSSIIFITLTFFYLIKLLFDTSLINDMSDERRIDFMNKLRTLRLEKELSQRELSALIPISRSNIAKYESGLAFPSIEDIDILSDFFGTDLEDIYIAPSDIKIPHSYFRVFFNVHSILYSILFVFNMFFIVVLIPMLQLNIRPMTGETINVLFLTCIFSIIVTICLIFWRFLIKSTKAKMMSSIFLDILSIANFILIVMSIIFRIY